MFGTREREDTSRSSPNSSPSLLNTSVMPSLNTTRTSSASGCTVSSSKFACSNAPMMKPPACSRRYAPPADEQRWVVTSVQVRVKRPSHESRPYRTVAKRDATARCISTSFTCTSFSAGVPHSEEWLAKIPCSTAASNAAGGPFPATSPSKKTKLPVREIKIVEEVTTDRTTRYRCGRNFEARAGIPFSSAGAPAGSCPQGRLHAPAWLSQGSLGRVANPRAKPQAHQRAATANR